MFSVTREQYLNTEEFMAAISENLYSLWKPQLDKLIAESKI